MAKKDSFFDQAKALVELPGQMYKSSQAAQRAKTRIPSIKAARKLKFDKKKYNKQLKKAFPLK